MDSLVKESLYNMEHKLDEMVSLMEDTSKKMEDATEKIKALAESKRIANEVNYMMNREIFDKYAEMENEFYKAHPDLAEKDGYKIK